MARRLPGPSIGPARQPPGCGDWQIIRRTLWRADFDDARHPNSLPLTVKRPAQVRGVIAGRDACHRTRMRRPGCGAAAGACSQRSGLNPRGAPRVVNRTIPDMINFCPQGTPIRARRVPENVLRSPGCPASTRRPFLIQPPPWGPAPVPEGELARCPDQAPGRADGKPATCPEGLGLLQLWRAASPYLTNFFQPG